MKNKNKKIVFIASGSVLLLVVLVLVIFVFRLTPINKVTISVPPPQYIDEDGVMHHTPEVYMVTYTYKGTTKEMTMDFAWNPPQNEEERNRRIAAEIQDELGEEADLNAVEYTVVKVPTEIVD